MILVWTPGASGLANGSENLSVRIAGNSFGAPNLGAKTTVNSASLTVIFVITPRSKSRAKKDTDHQKAPRFAVRLSPLAT